MDTQNPVEQALAKLGGVTQAIVATNGRWPEATLYRWKRQGYIPDLAACFLLEDLTGISARALGGVTAADGTPPPAPTGTDDLASRRRTYAAPAAKVAEKATATTVASAQRGRQKKGSRRSSTPYRDAAALAA